MHDSNLPETSGSTMVRFVDGAVGSGDSITAASMGERGLRDGVWEDTDVASGDTKSNTKVAVSALAFCGDLAVVCDDANGEVAATGENPNGDSTTDPDLSGRERPPTVTVRGESTLTVERRKWRTSEEGTATRRCGTVATG